MHTVQEQQRVAALHKLQVLDTPPEERFDRVVRLAQRLFSVPVVMVNLIDADRQFTKAAAGFETGSVPRTMSMCNNTIESDEMLEVPDALADPRFRDHPAVRARGMRFYAGAPLYAPGGERIGSLCLADQRPRALNDTEEQLLRDLADWVQKELATDDELIQAAEVQRRLLPRSTPDLPGYDVAGRCVQSRRVGGDFYDWQPLGDRFQVLIADVMGKGMPSALIGASVRAVFRGTSRFNDLSASMSRTATSLEEDLAENSSFVTMFVARLDPATGELEYVDAGHGLTAILSPDGGYRHLSTDGLPIGINSGDQWVTAKDRLEPGETLLSVSDGILDAYPTPEEALAEQSAIVARSPRCSGVVEGATQSAVRRNTADDATAIAVRRAA